MKRNKILLFACLAFAAMTLQSCLFEQEDIFDESSSARMQNVLKKTQQTLMSSDYGWLFEIYPEGAQGYGGYAFALKFTQTEVEVFSELAPGYSETSYYKMTNDNGPVLTFDTYNEIMHYFASPTSGNYQAFQGEFEFTIVDVTDDLIEVYGTRTLNTMYLRKLNEPAADYLAKIAKIENTFIWTGAKGTMGDKQVEFTVDTDYRQFIYFDEDGTEHDVAYTLTDKGVRFYKPIVIGGATIKEMTLSDSGEELTDNASGVKLKASFPEGYRMYNAYAGTYTLTYGSNSENSIDVELVPAGDGATYLMKGINPNYDIELTYSKGKGTLSMCTQMLKKDGQYVKYGDYYIGMVSWDAAKGYINYGTTIGMTTVWNGDEANPVYSLVDNAVWGTYKVSSYYFYAFTGTALSSSTRYASISGLNDLYPCGKTYNWTYLQTLTKK